MAADRSGLRAPKGCSIALIIIMLILIPMGAYMYFFDYVPGNAPGVGRLNLALRLESPSAPLARVSDPLKPWNLTLVLVNDGKSTIRALAASGTNATLEYAVFYYGADGQRSPIRLNLSPGALPSSLGGGVQNPAEYGIVELNPGREFSMVVPLSTRFNLTKPGHYRIEAEYNPKRLEQFSGLKLEDSHAEDDPLTANLEFDVLPDGPAPAPTPTGAPTKETVPLPHFPAPPPDVQPAQPTPKNPAQ